MTNHLETLQKAIELQTNGEADSAVTILLASLDNGIRHKDIFICLAAIYDQQKRLKDAANILELARLEHSESPSILSNLGGVLLRLGDHQKAIELLEAATVRDPKSVHGLSSLAIAYAELNDWLRSKAAAEIVLSIEPHNITMLQLAAHASVQIGQFSRGLNCYDHLASLKNINYLKNPAEQLLTNTNNFSRGSPSPRYFELSTQYAEMHDRRTNDSDKTFAGVVTFLRVAPYIKEYFDQFEYDNLLDYGGGQGQQYELKRLKCKNGHNYGSMAQFLGVQQVCVYDAGRPETIKFLGKKYNTVICTDVLEHCDRQDLPWIIEELFEHAENAVFATIATYPAVKHLPNGENAHCTLEGSAWWSHLFMSASKKFPEVDYRYLIVNDKNFNNVEAFSKT